MARSARKGGRIQPLPSAQDAKGEDNSYDLLITEADVGKRIDAFLASILPQELSRNRIKSLIQNGNVQLNQSLCDRPNQRLKQGDQIRIELPEPDDPAPKPEAIALDILYEDDSVIVINKPAGLVVHPAPGNWDGTLVNALIHHCGDTLRGIGGQKRPGIVHRLDRDTSGIMVVAKTQAAHHHLTAQFADHGKNFQLERRYLAIAWGVFPRRTGTIDLPLARARHHRLKRSVAPANAPDARSAITHYRVLDRLDGNGDGQPDAMLVECQLETGRTHQIRVHLSHLAHPLIGDRLYGSHMQTKSERLAPNARSQAQSMKRQALHAAILAFEHPDTGRLMRFETPLPQDMSGLLSAFQSLISADPNK